MEQESESNYFQNSNKFIEQMETELKSIQAGKISGIIKWESISPGETSEIGDISEIITSLSKKCETAITYIKTLKGALDDTISKEVTNVAYMARFQNKMQALKNEKEKLENEYLEKLCQIEALAYDGYYKQINVYNCPPNCKSKDLEEHLTKFGIRAEDIDIAEFKKPNNNIPLTAAITFKNCLEAFEAKKKLSGTELNGCYLKVKQTYYYSDFLDSMEQLQIVDYSDDEYEDYINYG